MEVDIADRYLGIEGGFKIKFMGIVINIRIGTRTVVSIEENQIGTGLEESDGKVILVISFLKDQVLSLIDKVQNLIFKEITTVFIRVQKLKNLYN